MIPPGSAPSFSIIIPTYQRRDVVCDAVRAIGSIDYPGWFELIVVVDGSTDGSAPALRKLNCPCPYRVIEQPNAGPAHARNQGAAAATGEIILFLDDDMMCKADILHQHALSHARGADAVLGEMPLEKNSPPGFLSEGMAAWADQSASEARTGETLTPFHFGGHFSVRRAVFEALGGYDSSFTQSGKFGQEDADLGMRLLAHHTVCHNPEAIAWLRYVVSPGQNLRRAFLAGAADVMFARKHLALARDLFETRRGSRPADRLLYRPLGRIPLLPALLVAVMARLAALILQTPLRSNRHFARLFYAVRQVAYWSGVHAQGGIPNATRTLVLCYHAIDDHSQDPILRDYSIPPAQFETHLRSLLRRGYVFVSAQDVLACLDGALTLPKRAVLLTFDDGYADLLEVARSQLQPKRIPALVFAVSAMASGSNEWDQPAGAGPVALLTTAQLRALAPLGIEVGCHSRTHRMLPNLSDSALASETRGAADDLEADGLPRPRFFAYPFGAADARVMAAVEAAGFAAGFGVADKWVSRASNRFNLPRVSILAGDPPWRYWLKTTFPRVSAVIQRYQRS